MSTIKHLFTHIRQYGSNHRPLYILSTMVLFWAVYDGILTFIAPLIIVQNGISESLMGIIIGSSSIAGAFFDFLMCRVFRNAKHRRIMIVMFSICLIYPLVLFQAKSFSVYLIAMVLWGLYYDLHNISNFEFVGRHVEKEEHSSSFGVIQVFQSLGYLVAPIFAGMVIGELVDWKPFFLAIIFLVISLIFFIELLVFGKKEKEGSLLDKENFRPVNFLLELSLWHRIGALIAPILVLTGMLYAVDAFFWTIGPLLAESLAIDHRFAGFFMVAYSLPPLLVGWIVGALTSKYGKKRTAFISFGIGSLFLCSMFLISNPLFLLCIVFLASFFISFSWPALNGVYADYISESKTLAREIEGIEDFFVNIGYVIGPIAAGFLAQYTNYQAAFSVLGILCLIASIFLFKITPRKIRITKAMETPSRFAVINELEAQKN